MPLRAGDTFFYGRPNPDRALTQHLWVVVTDPFGIPPVVAVVSLSTRRDGSDETVVLVPGDHPFVRRETVVFYADARVQRAEQLGALLVSGAATRHDQCSDAIVRRIQEGLLTSPNVERWIKGMCRPVLEPGA